MKKLGKTKNKNDRDERRTVNLIEEKLKLKRERELK